MNVRNWLIKKLGGYTRHEYEMIGALNPVKLAVSQKRIETIETRRVFNSEQIPEALTVNFAKRDMAYELIDKLLDDGYIEFVSKEPNDPFEPIEIRCKLMVVKTKGGEESCQKK